MECGLGYCGCLRILPSFEVLWKFVEVFVLNRNEVLNSVEPVFVNGSACCGVNANPRKSGTKSSSHLVIGLGKGRAHEGKRKSAFFVSMRNVYNTTCKLRKVFHIPKHICRLF